MPELPEVETIARTLAPSVEGKRVLSCTAFDASTRQAGLPLSAVHGQTLATPRRRGKLLILPFHCPDAPAAYNPATYAGEVLTGEAPVDIRVSGVLALVLHLKMTGRLFVYPPHTEPGPHTRLTLDFESQERLFFDDARRFGYARVVDSNDLHKWSFWNELGPEPLLMSPAAFVKRMAKRRTSIKALLLNQRMIAGCGNIYADESLFRAGIRPYTHAAKLSNERLELLHACLCDVLRESIAACGSSIRDYRTANGDVGAFQNSFMIYGRRGQPCKVCGSTLALASVTGRTTIFCPVCQKS